MLAKVKMKLSLAAAFVVGATTMIGLYCYATGLTEAQKSEIEKLQGTWILVAVEVGGQQKPEEQVRAYNSRKIFDGTRLYSRQTRPDGTVGGRAWRAGPRDSGAGGGHADAVPGVRRVSDRVRAAGRAVFAGI